MGPRPLRQPSADLRRFAAPGRELALRERSRLSLRRRIARREGLPRVLVLSLPPNEHLQAGACLADVENPVHRVSAAPQGAPPTLGQPIGQIAPPHLSGSRLPHTPKAGHTPRLYAPDEPLHHRRHLILPLGLLPPRSLRLPIPPRVRVKACMPQPYQPPPGFDLLAHRRSTLRPSLHAAHFAPRRHRPHLSPSVERLLALPGSRVLPPAFSLRPPPPLAASYGCWRAPPCPPTPSTRPRPCATTPGYPTALAILCTAATRHARLGPTFVRLRAPPPP